MNTKILFAFVCLSYASYGVDPFLVEPNPHVEVRAFPAFQYQLHSLPVDLLVDGELSFLHPRVFQKVPAVSRRVAQLSTGFLGLGAIASLAGFSLWVPAVLTLAGEPLFSFLQSQPVLRRSADWDARPIRFDSLKFRKYRPAVRDILKRRPQIVSEDELAYPKKLIIDADVDGWVRKIVAEVEFISNQRAGQVKKLPLNELKQAPGCFGQFMKNLGEAFR